MRKRLARKVWKARDRSLIPNGKDYWAVKWSNSQFYEGAIYDHRLAKCSKIIVKELIKENEEEREKKHQSR